MALQLIWWWLNFLEQKQTRYINTKPAPAPLTSTWSLNDLVKSGADRTGKIYNKIHYIKSSLTIRSQHKRHRVMEMICERWYNVSKIRNEASVIYIYPKKEMQPSFCLRYREFWLPKSKLIPWLTCFPKYVRVDWPNPHLAIFGAIEAFLKCEKTVSKVQKWLSQLSECILLKPKAITVL